MSTTRPFIFTQKSGQVDLYPIEIGSSVREWPFGNPDSANPVFFGGEAEGIVIASGAEILERRPSGAPFPIPTALGMQYQISIARLWKLEDRGSSERPSASLSFFDGNVSEQMYWLRLAWYDDSMEPGASTTPWKWKLFGGVMIPRWTVASDGIYQFNGSQEFTATLMREKDGYGAIPTVSL